MSNNSSQTMLRDGRPSIGTSQLDDQRTRNSSRDGFLELRDVRNALSQHTGSTQEINDPVQFNSSVAFAELPERPVASAQASDTVISALNTERIKLGNTALVTVTNVIDGQDGQELVLFGDGFTTVDHGTYIFTNTGADKLLLANVFYHFVFLAGAWYETAKSGDSYSAGAGISISSGTLANLYVGKSLCVFAGEVVSTTGGPHPFPNNVRKAVGVVDTTGMGQYRISVCGSSASGTGQIFPQLSYSTDGVTWSNDTALAGMTAFPSTTEARVSAWTTLPSGAKASTMYIAFRSDTVTDNVTVNTVHFEFKP